MDRHFEEELTLLKTRLLEMGGIAEERLRMAARAIVNRSRDQLDSVLTGDEAINRLHIEIDDRCLKLLALHQPMAVDLRAIVSTVKINTDLERVGDLAINIAEAGSRYLDHPPTGELVDLAPMAMTAKVMLRDALDAFVQRDEARARRVLDQDDHLDTLKDRTFRTLAAHIRREPEVVEPALDLLLVSRHLERVGDHATNIAEDVIFMVSARDVRHHLGGGR
jgi:phosphate transport system protein